MRFFRVLAAGLLLTSLNAFAGPVLHLSAQAQAEVAQDEMVVVLAVERDGAQLGPLNTQVLNALNSALTEARKAAGINARLGSVNTGQTWNAKTGRPEGWRVRGEIVLDSKNLPALGTLAGKLSEQMQLGSVQFRLSDEARAREVKRLMKEAAQTLQTRAQESAQAFGYRGFELKEIQMNESGGFSPRPPMPMMAEGMVAKAASAPVMPTDGGTAQVVVSFSGKVVLTSNSASSTR